MSDLAKGLDGLRPPVFGTVCHTCAYLAGLDEEDAGALRARFDETGQARLSAHVLGEYLKPFGGPGSTSIARHRRDGHV